MQFKLKDNEPWLDQLESFKRELMCEALIQTKGVQTEAAKLLGINERTFRYQIKNNKKLRELANTEKYVKYDKNTIITLFQLSIDVKTIANYIGISENMVRNILRDNIEYKKYKLLLEKNNHRRKNMHNVEEILANSRAMITDISEKIQKNKIDDLSDDHLFYAKVLLDNGFMTKTGEITDAGKKALYQ